MTDLEQILITMFKALESNDLNTYVFLRSEALELINEIEESVTELEPEIILH